MTEKPIPSLANSGYFSDYYLAYRLDAGLSELYACWDELDKQGEPNDRTRVRNLTVPFGTYRAAAALTAPDADLLDAGTLDLGDLHDDAKTALLALNDAILTALGWAPDRDGDPLTLASGEKTVTVPAAHVATTPTGVLLVALDTVFATDPAAVIASKTTPAGRLVEPVRLNDKPAARTALEAAQLIFTADDAPSYLLIVSGGAITLLDRERWGEGVSIGANLDDALARHDTKPQGELAAIAALFSGGAINPGDQAQSVLTSLLEKASTESAGVSKELRYGIRRSVELLANAVVEDVRERQKGAWMSLDPKALTRQSLRYLYRIIVLLFAEARPELGILPVDDPDYQAGYSVARLREVALVDLQTPHGRRGRHIQQSLDVLFRLVNDGHNPDQGALGDDARDLIFPALRSTLFDEKSCTLLDKAHLHDDVLQQVIQHLCFTHERAGRGRQPVSYSTLGINQLGAVYEGLMAYTGFLATEPLFEIAKDGDPDNGSWVIAVNRADEFPEEVFLKETLPDGSERRVPYEEGEFVFRLSGRDRQRSASYYTPEVLTEFTVRHALAVLFAENPHLNANDILQLTVCEPALGSGAFLNEAISQLAERYLKAVQDESGQVIDAEHYQLELQKAKAHFAVNQAYGVDLNRTAVELAEVSVWLNCMHDGLQAPWFGARLRCGNSLIGVRRATYTPAQVMSAVWAARIATAPVDKPIAEAALGSPVGIHHFLVPGQGWGAACGAPEIRELAPAWASAVNAWRRSISAPPNQQQLERLERLAQQVERLWARAANEVEAFWNATRQHIDVWGAETQAAGARFGEAAIREVLDNPQSATFRLRTLMDAWCSLWLWAPEHGTRLPTLDQWLSAAEALTRIDEPWDPDTLFADERTPRLASSASLDEIVDAHPWLRHTRTITTTQTWFHWELEFSPVFARGGFDLQVGNPPWVRPTFDEPTVLAELDPWWGLSDLLGTDERTRQGRRAQALTDPPATALVCSSAAEVAGVTQLLSSSALEPLLQGIQTNLYMNFMVRCWSRSSPTGAVGLLHPEGHFSESRGTKLRAATYRRLRRHWYFPEARRWFDGIVGQKPDFGVNAYGGEQSPDFLQMSDVRAVETVDRSLVHDGSDSPPSSHNPDGTRDKRPHRARVLHFDEDALRRIGALTGDGNPVAGLGPRLVKPRTEPDLSALLRFSTVGERVRDVKHLWIAGFHEREQRVDGTYARDTTTPTSLDELVLQGPHIGQQHPFANTAVDSDWAATHAASMPSDFIPASQYRFLRRITPDTPRVARFPDGSPYTTVFRETHREFVSPLDERTLRSCIIPPGPPQISSVNSVVLGTEFETVRLSALLSSLPYDFYARCLGVTHTTQTFTLGIPMPDAHTELDRELVIRALRLNCLTQAYAPLWAGVVSGWSAELGVPSQWSQTAVLRSDYERWLAQVEIDSLVCLLIGLSLAELHQIYRSHFPVLRAYEREKVFDGHGHAIARDRRAFGFLQGEVEAAQAGSARDPAWACYLRVASGERDVDTAPFAAPFREADRETAMSDAYWTFVGRYDLTPPDIAERPS